MKRNYYRAGFLMSALLLALAMVASGPTALAHRPNAVASRMAYRDSSIADGFDAVWKKFQEAVSKSDRKKVADMTLFPFYSMDLEYDLRGKLGSTHGAGFSRTEFLKFYDKLFDKEAREAIAAAPGATPMFDEENHIDRYAVGIHRNPKGYKWIEFRRDDVGHWMLARTDNVSY